MMTVLMEMEKDATLDARLELLTATLALEETALIQLSALRLVETTSSLILSPAKTETPLTEMDVTLLASLSLLDLDSLAQTLLLTLELEPQSLFVLKTVEMDTELVQRPAMTLTMMEPLAALLTAQERLMDGIALVETRTLQTLVLSSAEISL